MNFNADLLYQKYQGQTLSYDGIPDNAGQCAQWAEYVLTDTQYGYGLSPFWGNAIDWWNNYGGSLAAFDKLQDGTIKKGDIVIFNSLVGSVYGHIDMAMSDGSYAQFTGADSNWAGNKTVHLVNHVGSQYIQGVLRLKGGTMLPVDQRYMCVRLFKNAEPTPDQVSDQTWADTTKAITALWNTYGKDRYYATHNPDGSDKPIIENGFVKAGTLDGKDYYAKN